MGVIDEPRIAEHRLAADAETAEQGRGWEPVPDQRPRGAATIELGPAADHILIQGWRLLKSRDGKRD